MDPKNIGPEQEQFERYTDRSRGRELCVYDYRDIDGELFSCVCKTLDECRLKRGEWLRNKWLNRQKG